VALLPLRQRVRAAVDRGLFRIDGAPTREVVLVQRRVFILPTRQGVVFGVILLLMLAAAVNYALSLGYVLTFLLAAMALNAMLHTYRNLARLHVTARPVEPVFCGDFAVFGVDLDHGDPRDRYAIVLSGGNPEVSDLVDVPAGATRRAQLALPTTHRGRLRPGRLVLHTTYPLGLYRAWSYLELDFAVLVYPRPAPPGLPLPVVASLSRVAGADATGDEDFSGLRPYQRGDTPRQIAWKASARSDALLTKQFSGPAAVECILDWHALPPAWETERKLSQLTRWVLEADQAGIAYALALPGTSVAIASGSVHRRRCLAALALYEVTP